MEVKNNEPAFLEIKDEFYMRELDSCAVVPRAKLNNGTRNNVKIASKGSICFW